MRTGRGVTRRGENRKMRGVRGEKRCECERGDRERCDKER